MTRGGDVKSFFQQRKVHAGAATKPTGGVSKKAAQHQAAPAFHVHSVPVLFPIRLASPDSESTSVVSLCIAI
jgi:hypothetical protein